MCFPANFLFSWSIHRCEWGIKVSHYYCVTVNFPFHTLLAFALHIVVLLCWVHIYFKLLYLLGLILWSLCSVLLCLFSQPLFQSLFYLIWVLLLLLPFGLHLCEISFSSPSLSFCMCPLFWGGSLVDSIYRVLFLYPFSQSLSFAWGIQPIYI